MTILTTPEVLRIAADNIEAGRHPGHGLEYRHWEESDAQFRPVGVDVHYLLSRDRYKFRRAPKTITYTVTQPEPLREAPVAGTQLYSIGPAGDLCHVKFSNFDPHHSEALARGNLFATKEDAEAADKARLAAYQEASRG